MAGPAVFNAVGGVLKAFTGLNKGTLTTFKDAITGFASAAQEASGIDKLLNLDAILKPILDIIKPISTLITLFSRGISAGLQPALQEIMKTFLSPENMNLAMKLGKVIGSLIVPIVKGFIDWLKKMEPIFKILNDLGKFWADAWSKIGKMMAPFIKQLSDMFMPLLTKIITALSDAVEKVMPLIEKAMTDLMPVFEEVGAVIIQMIEEILPPIIDITIALIPVILELVRVFLELWLAFQPIRDLIIDLIVYAVEWLADALTWLVESGAFDYLIGGIKMFGLWIANLVDIIKWGWGILVETIGNIIKWFQSMGEILGNVWDFIVAGFKGFVNGLIGFINIFIEIWNALDFLDVAKIPTIPYLAEGGTITRTGPALVHKGEIVMNAEMMGSLITALGKTTTGGGDNNQRVYNTTVNAVTLNDSQITTIAKEIAKQNWLVER